VSKERTGRQLVYVTRSEKKPGLITPVRNFHFSSQTQRYMNKLLNFTFPATYPAFSGLMLFKDTVAICTSDLGCKCCPAVSDCTVLAVMLNKPHAIYNIPINFSQV